MLTPKIEGLRFKNAKKDEITIYVTIQCFEDRVKFVISDVTVRKYRTKTHCSINESTQNSYLYKCLTSEFERKEFLAKEYLQYVTEAEVEQAVLNAWQKCRPEVTIL